MKIIYYEGILILFVYHFHIAYSKLFSNIIHLLLLYLAIIGFN